MTASKSKIASKSGSKNDDIETVSVNILGKDYQVSCPPDERDSLIKSARHLDKSMREVRDGGKVIGLERIAVMAALNTTYELLQQETKQKQTKGVSGDKVKRLTKKIDDTLQNCRQLEI